MSARRRAALITTTVVLAGLSYFGWEWLSNLTFEVVHVSGNRQVQASEIEAVAALDSGAVLLDIEPSLVEERVRRHPWVEDAGVYRMPPNSMLIRIKERIPVALAVRGDGRPTAYLDRYGYAMPLDGTDVYDVPLVFGIPVSENAPIEARAVVELLQALGDVDADTDVILSSFEYDAGEILLTTTPVASREPIRVQLGATQFSERLRRMRTFWYKAVLPQPDRVFEQVDLRFDGQIVTREVSKK